VCLCTLEKLYWKGQFEATLKDDSGTNHAKQLDGPDSGEEKEIDPNWDKK